MNDNEKMDQYEEDDIITLSDNDGNEHDCVILDVLEHNDNKYAALVDSDCLKEEDDDENTEPTDLFIMKLEENKDGEYLNSIDDQDEYEEVCKLMIERLSDSFDIKE